MAKKINLHYMVLIFLIVLLAVFMGFRSPYFFTAANLCVLVDNFIMEAIMALGMTLVIISGGIDLTVAGVLPFSSIILALFMIRGSICGSYNAGSGSGSGDWLPDKPF